MRFGGHETFSIREGWLHKGLKMLIENPERWEDKYVADWLGVGKNMAKSIRYWLIATCLVSQEKKAAPLEVTELGRLIFEKDPYFVEPGTLWALHVNLCNHKDYITTWYWFFNHFRLTRFDRPLCLENLKQYIVRQGNKRLPSKTTLQRDIACLLRTYSRELPPPELDPEESLECPFTELGLLMHYAHSGSYRVSYGKKPIPLPLIGYSLACSSGISEGTSSAECKLQDASIKEGGPGCSFCLSPEDLYDLLTGAKEQGFAETIGMTNLAGERIIRFEGHRPLRWLELYYEQAEHWNLAA